GDVAGAQVEVRRQRRAEGDAQLHGHQPVQERLLEVEGEAVQVEVARLGEGGAHPAGAGDGGAEAGDRLGVVEVVVAEADPVLGQGAVVVGDGRVDDAGGPVVGDVDPPPCPVRAQVYRPAPA